MSGLRFADFGSTCLAAGCAGLLGLRGGYCDRLRLPSRSMRLCESCVTGRLRERWASFALVPALAWARSYGLGEPSATGAAWADDGLDDLSAAA